MWWIIYVGDFAACIIENVQNDTKMTDFISAIFKHKFPNNSSYTRDDIIHDYTDTNIPNKATTLLSMSSFQILKRCTLPHTHTHTTMHH